MNCIMDQSSTDDLSLNEKHRVFDYTPKELPEKK